MVVVTGATGHIGNVLVRELLDRKENVCVFVLPGEDTSCFDNRSLEIVEGDVRDEESLIRAFNKARIVFHLAGYISINPCEKELLEAINVEGTRHVVRACMACGVKRLVYASSVHALAEDTHAYMIDETIPFSPEHAIGEYGKSKARATAIVLESVKKGLDAVIVCPASVIGPYDFRPSKLGQFFLGFIKGKNPFFPGAAYNFVDVRDVAKGMILAAEQGIRGESYILSGERMSLHTLLSLMEKTTGCIMKKIQLPLWLCRIGAWFSTLYSRITKKNPLLTIESVSILASNSTMSYGKAWSILGFSPRPLSVTIADTIAWFKHYFKL